MEKLKLPVILSEGEDGYIVAQVPLIPGCISQGATIEEALVNIREAAELSLEKCVPEGWELPGEEPVELL
jgi:predicted RNase H-like HicB family nuclease